jgi:hypothetical protein
VLTLPNKVLRPDGTDFLLFLRRPPDEIWPAQPSTESEQLSTTLLSNVAETSDQSLA